MLKTYPVPLLEAEATGRMFLRTPSSGQGLQMTKARADEGLVLSTQPIVTTLTILSQEPRAKVEEAEHDAGRM